MTLARKTYLVLLLLAAAGLAGGSILLTPGPQEWVQPIEFSHRVHAGDNQISCLYCHSAAARSTVAGVPPVSTCYECHRLVKLRNPEINKVFQHWENNQPIVWVRIHSLPQHVYFSHKRHVVAGLACQSCHGDVQAADRVSQVASLTMGWCVDCHKERAASLECSTCHK
jgi:hypothetical protein